MFWRRNKWFGPENYCKIIKAYVEKKHENDNDFWRDNFLPKILEWKNLLNEEQTVNLLESVKELSKL